MTSIPVTYLFVPGNRPERFAKALASGADRIILDLEDAVTPPNKVAARLAVAQWFALAGDAAARVVLRINGSDSASMPKTCCCFRRRLGPACCCPSASRPPRWWRCGRISMRRPVRCH